MEGIPIIKLQSLLGTAAQVALKKKKQKLLTGEAVQEQTEEDRSSQRESHSRLR